GEVASLFFLGEEFGGCCAALYVACWLVLESVGCSYYASVDTLLASFQFGI
ncbi:hypothetical protein L195_g036386, partial [Trifolium pratense]